MRLSEYIQRLQEMYEKHGDLDVFHRSAMVDHTSLVTVDRDDTIIVHAKVVHVDNMYADASRLRGYKGRPNFINGYQEKFEAAKPREAFIL